jgi:acyl-CoA synthetase (AMP-forming)/AMP-acid ligase II
MLANDLERLPPELLAALTGPSSPFELTRENVRGVEMTVFAERPPHVPAMLLGAAGRFTETPYFVFGDRQITYKETADQVPALAGLLRHAHGIQRGDRVAIAAPNSVEYLLTLWALAWLGAISVSLNGWWTGDELRYGLALSGPKLLLGEERQLSRLDGGAPVPTFTFEELFSQLAPDAAGIPVEPGLTEDDPLSILFTSGTTGRPKGAVITHRGLVNFAQDATMRGAAEALRKGDEPAGAPPVGILASPFFHVSGINPLLASAPYNGMTLIAAPRGRWDPTAHLELTVRYGVTQWSGVPTQLMRLLRHPQLDRYDISKLRTVGSGGAPISTELATLYETVVPHARPAQGYGMSETCGQGTTIAGELMIAHPQSIGLATPTSEVKLRDLDGRDIDTTEDTVGEIMIRSPSTFLGYWNDPAATAAVLSPDGWYATGDYGRYAHGMLQLESRLRDMVIRGGENIYPIEIENRLSEHPGIADAAVIGVQHEELGQEVMAVIVVKPGAGLTAEEVRSWVGQTLARYKVPAHVRFVEGLPYSPTGKLLKREIEALYAS